MAGDVCLFGGEHCTRFGRDEVKEEEELEGLLEHSMASIDMFAMEILTAKRALRMSTTSRTSRMYTGVASTQAQSGPRNLAGRSKIEAAMMMKGADSTAATQQKGEKEGNRSRKCPISSPHRLKN